MSADTPAERLEVTRSIPAPVAAVFALLAQPEQHVAIDGSGTLILSARSDALTAVGDEFEVDMRQEPLGDYRMRNIVTAYEVDAWLEWAPTHLGHNPIGYRYGYLLRPGPARDTTRDTKGGTTEGDAGEGRPSTLVTAYYDWSAVSERWRGRISFPGRAEDNLAASLANLAKLAGG